MRFRAALASRRTSLGQTMVEFALILPAFMMLTVGVLDVARAAWAYVSLQDAVREGTRTAITIPLTPSGNGLTSSTTTGVVASALVAAPYLGLDSSQLGSVTTCGTGPLKNNTFTLSAVDGNGNAEYCHPAAVTLTATYTFQPIVSLLLGQGSVAMSATSTTYEP